MPVADTIAPYVSGVKFLSTDGSYGVGADIQIVVEFSERVLTNGSPTLELQLGGGTVLATLVSGSGTSELLFKYTVQDGDTGTSINYVGTDSLAFAGEGAIRDGSGNDAVLTLPLPSAAASV